jgi:rhodanese-related sulfurtransferase
MAESVCEAILKLAGGQGQAPKKIATTGSLRYHTKQVAHLTQERAMEHSEGFLKLVNAAKSRVRETTPEQVREKQEAKESFHFVDVREDSEWQKGHAAGAVHLGKGIIERDIEKAVPDHNAEIILYCGGGYRSALAADALQEMGYTNVISMDGGWTRWRELGYPVESE